MGQLSAEERNSLRQYLSSEGLTFKPLLDDMVDHFACTLEEKMQSGMRFADAFEQTKSEIPTDHFNKLQQETMETIDKRYNVARGLSWLTLGMLLGATIFKLLHLRGASELLIASFIMLAASLLSGSLSGILRNRDKKGALRLLALVAGVILLLAGFTFTVLHLPGNTGLTFIAVIIVIVAGVANTLHAYSKTGSDGNLLTWLHEKYSPGIERFLLLLFAPLLAFKAITMYFFPAAVSPVANIGILIVVYGAALQFIAIVWRSMEKNPAHRTPAVLAVTILVFILFNLPFLTSVFNIPLRGSFIMLFMIAGAWLTYTLEEKPMNTPSMIVLGLIPLIFTTWSMTLMSVLPTSSSGMIFNAAVLVVLLAAFFFTRPYSISRAFFIVAVSSYMFEYTA